MEIWPAILVAGVSFAVPQFLVSNYIGPELVDVIAAIVSMVCLVLFLRVWQPKTIWTSTSLQGPRGRSAAEAEAGAAQFTQQPTAVVVARLDALDRPDGVRLHLGPAAVKACAQRHLRAQRSRSKACTRWSRRCRRWCPSRTKEGRGLHLQPAVGHRHRHPAGGDHRRAADEVQPAAARAGLRPHALAGALLAADHRADAGAGHADALFGARHHARPGVRQHRRALSVLRHPDGLARRRADRLRHGVERAVRRHAEGGRRAARA